MFQVRVVMWAMLNVVKTIVTAVRNFLTCSSHMWFMQHTHFSWKPLTVMSMLNVVETIVTAVRNFSRFPSQAPSWIFAAALWCAWHPMYLALPVKKVFDHCNTCHQTPMQQAPRGANDSGISTCGGMIFSQWQMGRSNCGGVIFCPGRSNSWWSNYGGVIFFLVKNGAE